MNSKVYLVDDDAQLLQTTGRFLESKSFSVVAFPSGEDFLEQYVPGDPGCLLLDLMMPSMSGLDVLDMMRELKLTLPTIVMTAFGSIPTAVQAIKRGAFDFIEKPIHNNSKLVSLVKHAITESASSLKGQQEAQETSERLLRLTDREREILMALTDGLSSNEIANEFGVSLATVHSHRNNIFKKMEVNSIANLISLMARSRAVPPSGNPND